MIYIKVVRAFIETGMNEILFGIHYDAALETISTASLEWNLRQWDID